MRLIVGILGTCQSYTRYEADAVEIIAKPENSANHLSNSNGNLYLTVT